LLVGVTALVGAAALLAWNWTEAGLSGEEDSYAQEVKRSAELDQVAKGLMRRLDRKERVTRALLAGRLTLLEAAAYFSALNQAAPEFHWGYFRETTPGDTDEERHCHKVIECAYM